MVEAEAMTHGITQAAIEVAKAMVKALSEAVEGRRTKTNTRNRSTAVIPYGAETGDPQWNSLFLTGHEKQV